MLGVKQLTSLTPVVARSIGRRNMSVVPTPARNKISKGEKVVLGTAMVLGWTFVPAWVLVHIKEYRGED